MRIYSYTTIACEFANSLFSLSLARARTRVFSSLQNIHNHTDSFPIRSDMYCRCHVTNESIRDQNSRDQTQQLKLSIINKFGNQKLLSLYLKNLVPICRIDMERDYIILNMKFS